jgi:hypothetical protein
MDDALRTLDRTRAKERCEYCRVPQRLFEYAFHLEHVTARQHGGLTVPENLALACDRCNFHKGTNLSAVDPLTGQIVLLFHPRTQVWSEHFAWSNAEIVGETPQGRATAALLQMNAVRRLQIRTSLIVRGWRPDAE